MDTGGSFAVERKPPPVDSETWASYSCRRQHPLQSIWGLSGAFFCAVSWPHELEQSIVPAFHAYMYKIPAEGSVTSGRKKSRAPPPPSYIWNKSQKDALLNSLKALSTIHIVSVSIVAPLLVLIKHKYSQCEREIEREATILKPRVLLLPSSFRSLFTAPAHDNFYVKIISTAFS